MKIGVLNNLYGPFQKGGAEKVVAKMISDWRAAGHEVFLITTKPSGAATPPETDFPVYYLPSRYYDLVKTGIFYRFFWQLNNLCSKKKSRAIKKILLHAKPDLVMTHNLMGLGFQTPRLLRKMGIRHEHFLHDIQLLHPSGLMFYGQESQVDSRAARVYQSITRRCFASPAKIISPSRWLLDEHVRRGFFANSDHEVRPFQKAAEKPGAHDFKEPARNFLFVGQMTKAKGIYLLLDAFKKLDNPAARLVMIGSGSELENVKQIARSDSRISVEPWSENTETRQLGAGDYLIVPSLCYENSPTIIAKAHDLGSRIIASDLGGIPEIILKNDILFTPAGSEELRKILEKVSAANIY